jgi:hypothetical protein
MKELLRVLRQYVTAEIDFESFRREMVVRYLSARNLDSTTESTATTVDAACSDFSEGLISEVDLKNRLSRLGQYMQESKSPNAAIVLTYFDSIPNGMTVCASVGSGTSGDFLQSIPLSSSRNPLPNDLIVNC